MTNESLSRRALTRLQSLALVSALVFAAFASCAEKANAQLDLSGVIDLVAPWSMEPGNSERNRFDARVFEITLAGAIDQTFDGRLMFAGHSENGVFVPELHEGFVSSSKLIPMSRFRLGKFFLGVGRLNQFHQHDWPFITAPIVQREFFNPGRDPIVAEGAMDTGVEYSILLPLPFYLDLTIGVTNGYCYGHCHGPGNRPLTPLHYVHPVTFFDFGGGKGLQLGANYMGRVDFQGEETVITGLDVVYKERQGRRLVWLFQGELFHRAVNRQAGDTSTLGGYVYPQYGFDEEFSLGVRVDSFSQLNRSFNTTGERQNDLDYAFVPTFTWKPSEFSTIRLAYSHEVNTTQGEVDVRDRRFDFQFTYILGAHPAHEF